MRSRDRLALLVASSIAVAFSSCVYDVNGSLNELAKTVPAIASPQQQSGKTVTSVSLGFDFKLDAFSFANWGRPPDKTGIDVQSMVKLFGANQVCKTLSASNCVLTDSASMVRNRLEKGLLGGHCEGMVVSAGLNYLSRREGRERPIKDSKSASSTVIATWWATQVDSRVQTASKTSRTWKPSQIAMSVFESIRKGEVVTMGLYFAGLSHTLLPISATWKGKTLSIGVYDPNFPGKTMFLNIDTATETWVYEIAAYGSKMSERPSGTGSGGLDLVSIKLRSLPMSAAIRRP